MSFGGVSTRQSNQVGFLAPIQLGLVVAPRATGNDSRLYAFFNAPLAHPSDGRQRYIQSPGNGLVIIAAIGF